MNLNILTHLIVIQTETMSNEKCCSDPFKAACNKLTERTICANAVVNKGSCFGDGGGKPF